MILYDDNNDAKTMTIPRRILRKQPCLKPTNENEHVDRDVLDLVVPDSVVMSAVYKETN